MFNKAIFYRALKISLPIFLAYFPLGMVFGLVFENAGYLWFLGPFMSLIAYAGAMQFLALSMLDQHANILQLLLACFFIAARNIFYGPAFFERFSKFSFLTRTYLKFGLVDATYALLLATPEEKDTAKDEKYCLYLSFLNHFYWVSGTFVGGVAGRIIPEIKGLDFALTALFTIFTLDQYYKIKKIWPFIVALTGWILMQFILPKYSLLGAITFSMFLYTIIINNNINKSQVKECIYSK